VPDLACPKGEDYILHPILDFIVDNYRPVIDRIQAEVDGLEEEVLRNRWLAGSSTTCAG
jgi:magnesium transporter